MNGLNIHVSDADFKNKTPDEKLWMIYQGVVGIDNNGCKFSRLRHEAEQKRNWKGAVIVGAGTFAGAFAFFLSLWKFVLCK